MIELNKKIDLWNIYRLVKQRYQRAKCESQKDAAFETLVAIKVTRDNPTISNAIEFENSEKKYLNHPYTKSNSKSYGAQVVSAISTNLYVINKPRHKIYHLGNCDPEIGRVYIASSSEHPNEIKIGHTTLLIKERPSKYSYKYGYTLDLEYFAEVSYPARIEHKVAELIKNVRTSGCTNGDSIEWFFCEVDLAVNTIQSVCASHNFIIYSQH